MTAQKATDDTACAVPGCHHSKIAHCRKHRKGGKVGLLWMMPNPYHPDRPRLISCPEAFSRGMVPIKCRHHDPANPLEIPRCQSAACTYKNCGCSKFLSPYVKPRAPRKKRPEMPTEQLTLALSNEVVPL